MNARCLRLGRWAEIILSLPAFQEAWPHLCGAELLIVRFRTECFQLDEPECHDAEGRPVVGAGFDFPAAGARPFWPLHETGGTFFRKQCLWSHPCGR